MSTYHASFRGIRANEVKSVRDFAVIVNADSIYEAEDRIKEKFELINGLCITNIDDWGMLVVNEKKVF